MDSITQTELRERAEVLAELREDNNSDEARDRIDVIPFYLGNETYGIELKFISQVYPLGHYIPIPGAPSHIVGMTNILGCIYSILDLRSFFSLPGSRLTNLNKLLILQWEDMEFGILADEVGGLIGLGQSDLGENDDWKGSDTQFIRGVTQDRLILIDAEKLIMHPSIIVDQAN